MLYKSIGIIFFRIKIVYKNPNGRNNNLGLLYFKEQAFVLEMELLQKKKNKRKRLHNKVFWLHTSVKAKHNNMFKKIIFIFGFVAGLSTTLTAQTEWKNWNAINVEASFLKKAELQLGHMRSYNISNHFKNEFNQTVFQLGYRHNRKWFFSARAQFIKPVSATETRTRIFIRAAHTTRLLNKKINWSNSLGLENNSSNENRFRQRVIIGSRLSLRNRITFLNLSPSVAYNLFYNIGGNAISYYDVNNKLIERNNPNGFHRGRLTVSVNSKISKYLRLNVFFMAQREFNLLASQTRKMNVYDPVRAKIIRPFDNYNVVGGTLSLSLNDLF
jgi:hypothetical protein